MVVGFLISSLIRDDMMWLEAMLGGEAMGL